MATKKSSEVLARSIFESNKVEPLSEAATRIKSAIMQASKTGLLKSNEEIKLEIKNLERTEQLFALLGDTDAEKEQAKKLKELLDATKKGLKSNNRFHTKFFGYIASKTKERIADAIEDIPFIGPLFGLIRESRKDALEQSREARETVTENAIDLIDGDSPPLPRRGGRRNPDGSPTPTDASPDTSPVDSEESADRLTEIERNTRDIADRIQPSEEQERERERRDQRIIDALEDIRDGGPGGGPGGGPNPPPAPGGPGFLSNLFASLLGGVGGVALLLARFKKVGEFFGKFTRLIARIPGVGLIAKALGKILRFPVTFVMATVNGIWSGVDEYLKSGDIGKAAQTALDGFADFFLLGFLEPIQEIVTNAIAKVSEYVDPAFRALEIATKYATPQGLAKLAYDEAFGEDKPDEAGVVQTPKPLVYTPMTPEAKAAALANPSPAASPTNRPAVSPSKNLAPVRTANNTKSAIHEPEFMEQSKAMADRLGIDHTDLMKIMHFEADGINPQAINYQRNKETGEMEPKASGLIQFMPTTAPELGTTVEEIRKMSGTEQLPYVEEYLKQHGVKPGMGLSEIYMSVLAGNAKAAGQKSLWDKGSVQYEGNKNLDIKYGNNDGEVSPQEATNAVEQKWQRSGRQMFEEMPMGQLEARDTAEMTYQTDQNRNQASVAPPVNMSSANQTVVNNSNSTNNVMMTPVRHQDSTKFKFNPVLV